MCGSPYTCGGGGVANVCGPLVSFSNDLMPVFSVACTECHEFSMRNPTYAALTSTVPAGPTCGGSPRLVPGNGLGSLLYQKVARTAACGGPMPPAVTLPPATVDLIRRWIDEGAQNN
jgi:hypothetical protein